MSKYTPGPWSVSGGRSRPDLYGHMVGPDKFGIACVAYSDRTIEDHVTSLADARLIAAAPDLLEALKALTEEAHMHMTGGHGGLIDAARRAIAKAETLP